MNRAQQFLKLLESPYDSATQDILSIKTKIHDHQAFIRKLQNKPSEPTDGNGGRVINPNLKKDKIDYHQNMVRALQSKLKTKQDTLSQLNHSASGAGGASAGASSGSGAAMSGCSRGGGSQGSSVNNLGQIPVGYFRKKKHKKT